MSSEPSVTRLRPAMRFAGPAAALWMALTSSSAFGSQPPPVAEPSPPSPHEDRGLFDDVSERSLERVRFDCRAQTHRRDVTLFANGTLRLKQGEPGSEAMWLVELAPEERDAFLARLAGDDREESDIDAGTVVGEWVERCRLVIHLPGRLPEQYELGRFDTLSLALRRAVAIAEELVARVDVSVPPEGGTRLPVDYRAEVGDELRRADGAWFRVEGYTADGGGLELSGIEQPVVVYIATANLAREFVELRRRPRFGR